MFCKAAETDNALVEKKYFLLFRQVQKKLYTIELHFTFQIAFDLFFWKDSVWCFALKATKL